MSKSLKRVLLAIIGLIGLLIITAVILFFFVDANVYKSRLEKAASDALGMEVHVSGRMGIAFLPVLHIRVDDVHIRNRGMEIAAAKQAELEIALLPLLDREVLIRSIVLQRPTITLKRERGGKFNFEPGKEARGTVPAPVPEKLSLSEGTFIYRDEQTGEGFEVENFNLDVRSLWIAGSNGAKFLKNISFTAEFACPKIRTKDLVFSDVKFTCKGKDGVFILKPVTLRLFEGQGSATIDADFSGSVPRYEVRSSLAKFRIESYLKTLSAKKVAEGSMDFSANLSLHGNTEKQIKQSAGGEVSLRGENLTIYGNDLDREFSRFESSQKFNLLDVGAFFFAGPLGLALTKGYNFVTVFGESGGSSRIGNLYSSWRVEHGMAQAMDVAMATRENRIALKGRIDFVNGRFDDVTIALIDANGCSRVQQKIRGPIRKPVVEKPNVLTSLAGPALNLLKQAGKFLTGTKCEVFYSGSVSAPK